MLVTVIIPCYNVEKYVSRSINSILNQTYSNLQILIFDDASTDSTLNIIKEFKDNRIEVFEFKSNTQKIGAFNKVLQFAKGDLIAIQDSDDWSELDRIEKQVHYFELDKSLGICFTNYNIVSQNKRTAKNIALTNIDLHQEFLNFRNHSTILRDPTCCPSMMITKEVLNETLGYHSYFTGRVAEDIHWVYRILKISKGITIDDILYNYSVRENSLTQNQLKGIKAKYIYSWHLLSYIIQKDIKEGIDLLAPSNEQLLRYYELLACEEALQEATININNLILRYQNSVSFRIGRMLLTPIRFIKLLITKKSYH